MDLKSSALLAAKLTLPLRYHQIPAKIWTLKYSVHSAPQTG